MIARRDSHIRSVSDLRGKTIALPSKGSAQFSSFWFLAGHFGLSESTLTALPMSNRAAEWALITGAVDAVFRVRAPGDSSIKQLVRRADITLIPVDQAQALHLRHSTIRPGMIPKGSYRGSPPVPITDLPTASVNRLLVAAESVPVDVVYAITEVLFERRRELSELSSLASLTSAPDRYAGTHLPLHEGAESYYDREEPGIWSEQADFLRTLVSLVAVFGSMTFAFRNWFQGRQKDRADAHNKNLVDLYEQACLQEFSTDHYQRELANILTQVVDDLDNDRISNDGFDEFSFTWQAVSQLISNVPTRGSEIGHAEDAVAAK